jgi:DNA-binding CsgD family transcriptional regulator
MTTYVTPVLDPGMPELIETGANAHVLCVEVPLTDSEKRVLRYLPTQLTAPEIARQLFLSVHTVTTHIRHIYAKLGVHRRHEAVDRARARGLLAPIPGSRRATDQSVSRSGDTAARLTFPPRTTGSAPPRRTVNSRRAWPGPACLRTRRGQTDGAPGQAIARPVQAAAAAYVDPRDLAGKIPDGRRYGYPFLWVVRGPDIVKRVVE